MPAGLAHLKVVIRCADYDRSREFYAQVLALPVVEEWDEDEGRGCVFEVAAGAWVEIYEMTQRDARFSEAFTRPVVNDKIDLQLHTDSLDAWVARLNGVWAYRGPETLPWGQRWIQLRDPDRVLVAIYEAGK